MNNNILSIVAQGVINRLDSRVEASTPERIERWKVAVSKAVDVLEATTGYRLHNNELVIHSPSSGNIYIANRDSCQCEAKSQHQPCWHRAAFTLVTKYNQIENVLQQA